VSHTGGGSRSRPPGERRRGLPTPFARPAFRWIPGLALLLLSTGLLLWSLGLGSAAGAPERDDLEELRRRLEAGDVAAVAAEVEERLARLAERAESGAAPPAVSARRADLLDLRVETYWRGGEIHSPEAWRLARAALEMREELVGPDHPDLLPSLDNLGILNAERGDYARAAHFFGRALEIRRRALPGTGELGRGLYRLGNLHQLEGELIEARALYEESLEVTRHALGPEDVQVANILDALGVVERALGHRETARRLNRASLELRERLQGPDHIDLAYSLYHLGELAMTSGDTREALVLLRRALAIDRGALGPDHPLVATDLQGLAVVHHELGNRDRARELLGQALDIRRRVLGPDHPMVGESSTYLAMLLLETVDPGEAGAPGRNEPDRETADTVLAEALLSRAVEILEASLGEDHRLTVESLTGLAAVHWLQGRWPRAVEEALEAEDRARHHFFRTAHSLTQDEALRLRPAAVSSGLDIALTALASPEETAWTPPTERVWSALVRSRGLVMDEMVRRRRFMRRGAPEEVRRKAVRLAASRDRLERLLTRDLESVSPEAHHQRLERARRELEEAERALAAVTTLHRRPRAETAEGPRLADVRRALPPGAALVAYATYRRLTHPGVLGDGLTPGPRERSVLAYMALVLPPDGGEPRAVPLGDARTIEALVTEWQRQVAVPDRDLHGGPGLSPALARAGKALRRAVWDPLAPSLAGAELVLVVPDGALHRVSLATLPARSLPRGSLRAEPERAELYLVETGPPIHYLSTERDLIRHRQDQGAGRGLLVVGAPDLEPGARLGGLCPGDPGLELPSLPGSSREVEEIAALWREALGGGREVSLLSGPRAREETLAEEAEGRRVIHLATHGFVRTEPCTASESEPLLASGLVLSGPPPAGRNGGGSEDGILYAEELAALDLSGVEWVVLSACETGLGPVEGREGVLGLRRALETSGAETLIMSLWKVQDRATREWMGALYRERLAGASTAEAVQAASRRVLETRRRSGRSTHPFFWGAFVASGGWE